jgi:hypothetical protein
MAQSVHRFTDLLNIPANMERELAMDTASLIAKTIRLFETALFVGLWTLLPLGPNGWAAPPADHSLPLTIAQIVQMHNTGSTADEIIASIRRSHTIYRMDETELANLRKEGMPRKVVTYMQQTYEQAVQRNPRLKDWGLWTRGAGGHYYYYWSAYSYASGW